MRLFNSLQIVILYAAGPSLISWLFTDPFLHAKILAWVSCAGYLGMTWLLVAAVFTAAEKWEW